MALTEEDKQVMCMAKDYGIRVIRELAQPGSPLSMEKTLEIDEAMDIIADYCLCMEKDHCIKLMKKGHGAHALHDTATIGGAGPYGR